MKNSTNILLGILGAAAAGVVIGMIIAPQKGSDLRKGIKGSANDFSKKLSDLLSQGKDKYNEIRSMIDDETDNLKDGAKDLAKDVHGTYNEYSNKAEEAYNDISNEANKAYKKAKA